MSKRAKREYLQEIRKRYKTATKDEKKKILDEFCTVCGYNRKYAIRILNNSPTIKSNAVNRRGRRAKYNTAEIKDFLKKLWISTNLICSKRLKVIISLWLPWYQERKKLSKEEIELLKKISPATIDRILSTHRRKYSKRGLCTTKPGSILRELIPIKTEQWDEKTPGYIEADTVAHCGGSLAGSFVYTLNVVDIATGWTSQRAVWGKGEMGIVDAMRSIESTLPFKILGFDSDNGSEFLNWALLGYFKNRKRPVKYTRSRAYKKNDNAHIEEKNWTIVRQYLGYQRLDKQELVIKLNDLYTKELSCLINFFLPSVKLLTKQRIGSKIIKVHDKPKTPFERLLESNILDKEKKQKLLNILRKINPYKVQKELKRKINEILNLAVK
jgi:hypothetical protein